jgi:hypothetical protein
MPTSSLASASKEYNGRVDSGSMKRRKSTFSHPTLLRNRLIREFLEKFPEKDWDQVIKLSAVAGMQSFLVLEQEHNTPLNVDQLEGHIVNGAAAMALKTNMEIIQKQKKAMEEEKARAEYEKEHTFVREFIPPEQPIAGRRFAKFPFVDDGTVAEAITGDLDDNEGEDPVVVEIPEGEVFKNSAEVARNLRPAGKGTVKVRQRVVRGPDGMWDDPNTTTPDWWPNDILTEMLNQGAFDAPKRRKHPKKKPPRMAYSVPEAIVPENPTKNDLVTTKYLDRKGTGYGPEADYVPKKVPQKPVKIEVDISGVPIAEKERRNRARGAKAKKNARPLPKHLKKVTSKVKQQVSAYRRAAMRAKSERQKRLEMIMSPDRPALTESNDYALPSRRIGARGGAKQHRPPPTLDTIADAFLNEFEDLASDIKASNRVGRGRGGDDDDCDDEEEGGGLGEEGAGWGDEGGASPPAKVALDPWSDADVYVPVNGKSFASEAADYGRPKPAGVVTRSRNDDVNIMSFIEVAAESEREVRARRFQPTFEGWVGDFGAVHTHTNRAADVEDEYQPGAPAAGLKGPRAPPARTSAYPAAVADGDDGLSIAQYALPTSMEDHGDLFGNDQINKSKSIEEDPSLKRETVEETLRKAEDALQAIRDEEVESDVHLASVESETARTERIVKEPPMVFQEDPGQRRGTVVMGGSNRSGSVYVPPEDDGEAWEDASTPAKPDDGSQVEGTLPDLSTKGDAELSAIEKELMEGAL